MVKKKSSGKGKPFTKKELKVVREKLLDDKARILEDLMRLKSEGSKSLKDASGDLSGYSFHMADMPRDLYDREFTLELAEGERTKLFSLDDAIKRVDEGAYGKCDACGESISKQRLKVVPQAEHCIGCQKKEEKSAGR